MNERLANGVCRTALASRVSLTCGEEIAAEVWEGVVMMGVAIENEVMVI